MLRCFNVCNEKIRKLEFLMLFVNLALENERKMDFPMPIVKTTNFPQNQWKKCNPFVVIDLSVDMPNVVLSLNFRKDRLSPFSVKFYSRTRRGFK